MRDLRFLALSGSLRKLSYNTAALGALRELASSHIKIMLGNIDELPLFNPDREDESIPSVAELKSELKKSDGLIIASPEYAHGISGVLKNALDWLVSGDEFVNKPIMLVNTSPRASHAQESLREVLRTMSGNMIENAFTPIPLLGSDLDVVGIVASEELSSCLKAGLDNFCAEVDLLLSGHTRK